MRTLFQKEEAEEEKEEKEEEEEEEKKTSTMAHWCTPAIPALREARAGRSL